MIIERQGQIEKKTPRQKTPDIYQVKMPYIMIIDDGGKIIKVEGAMITIRINNEPCTRNDNDRQYDAEQWLHVLRISK